MNFHRTTDRILSVLLEQGEATPASAVVRLGWKNSDRRRSRALAFELWQLHHQGVVVLDAVRDVYVLHPLGAQKYLAQQRAQLLAQLRPVDAQLAQLQRYMDAGRPLPAHLRKPSKWKGSGRGIRIDDDDLDKGPRQKRGRSL